MAGSYRPAVRLMSWRKGACRSLETVAKALGYARETLLKSPGGAAAVGLWLLAHRHGRLQDFVDANKDGVDDRVEGLENCSNRSPVSAPPS